MSPREFRCFRSTRLHAPRRLSDDPFQRLALVALIEGSDLRMQENSDRADQPMLPVVCDNDCDAIYLLLVVFYEYSMIFKGRDILPAIEPGGINQQPDLLVPTDNKSTCGAIWRKSSVFNLSGTVILNTLPEIVFVLIK